MSLNDLWNERNGASKNYGSIEGIFGVILLPDKWKTPSGLKLDYPFHYYSLAEWTKMENAGAVFLPAAHNTSKGRPLGNYWSSSTENIKTAWFYHFESHDSSYSWGMSTSYGNLPEKKSVRLVRIIH